MAGYPNPANGDGGGERVAQPLAKARAPVTPPVMQPRAMPATDLSLWS
jgi:hypothetical protein